MLPTVTAIVPMYNVENYIYDSLGSILGQTLQSIEVIVIDDGSTDGSRAIAENICRQTDRVRLVSQPENQGAGAARNLGVLLARGEYVTFVDSDDAILPNALAVLYEAAKRYGADVVHSSGFLAPEDNEFHIDKPVALRFQRDYAACRTATLLPESIEYRADYWLRHRSFFFPWGKLFRRDFLIANHIWFPPTIAEDILFMFPCLCHAKTYVKIPETIYIYRQSPKSLQRGNDAVAHAEKAAASILLGFKYLEEHMARLPQLKGNAKLWEKVQRYTADFFHNSYCVPAYTDDGQVGEGLEKAIEKALSPYFPRDIFWAKYVFNGFSSYRAQGYKFLRQLEQLRQDVWEMLQAEPIEQGKVAFYGYRDEERIGSAKHLADIAAAQGLAGKIVCIPTGKETELPSEKMELCEQGTLKALRELATSQVIVAENPEAWNFAAKAGQRIFFLNDDENDMAAADREAHLIGLLRGLADKRIG